MRLGRGSEDAGVGARLPARINPEELDPRCVGGAAIGVCGAVLVLLLISFAVVAPTEFGVKYNHLWQQIDDKPIDPGRHFIGPWSSIIAYPSVVRTIEFSSRSKEDVNAPLKTRTSEGLDLTVHVAFQYQLKNASLPEMYKRYKNDYVSVFTRRATSSLLAVAGSFQAVQYWEQRKDISDQMLAGLVTLFEKEAHIRGLQILIIDLPGVFEKKIVETEVQKQIEKTRLAEQDAAVIRAGIEVTVAEKTREQTIIEKQAAADALLLQQTAQANAQKDRLDVETHVIQGVKDATGLATKQLVDYQRGVAYQNLNQAQFIFGAAQTAAILNVKNGLGATVTQEEVETSLRTLARSSAQEAVAASCNATTRAAATASAVEALAAQREEASAKLETKLEPDPMTPAFDVGFLS